MSAAARRAPPPCSSLPRRPRERGAIRYHQGWAPRPGPRADPAANLASRIMPPAMISPGPRDRGRPPGARPKEDHRRRASRHAAPQLSVRQGAAAIGSWRRPPPGGRCAGRGTPASAAHDSLPVQGPRAGEQFEPRMGRSLRRRGLPLHPPRAGPEAFRARRQQRRKLSTFRSPCNADTSAMFPSHWRQARRGGDRLAATTSARGSLAGRGTLASVSSGAAARIPFRFKGGRAVRDGCGGRVAAVATAAGAPAASAPRGSGGVPQRARGTPAVARPSPLHATVSGTPATTTVRSTATPQGHGDGLCWRRVSVRRTETAPGRVTAA